MNIISLSFHIALRLHRNSKHNKMISFISIIAVISTSLSIIILIVCLSAINGFKNELNERILSIIPHGTIESMYSEFYNWPTILYKIKNIPGITHATPYTNFTGLIEKENKFHPIYIHGIHTLFDIHQKITTYLSSDKTIENFIPDRRLIILGKGAADSLKIKKNDSINVLIYNPNSKNKFLSYEQIHVKVLDILNLRSYLDNNLAIIPLLDAQHYLKKKEDISGINIKVNNIFHVSKLLKQIKTIINDHIIIYSWSDTYKYIYNDIQTVRIIIYLTMTLIIGITSFSTVSILTLIIKEKHHDIAILNTLGGTNYLIYITFIWYGLLNSLLSIIIGGSIGTLISLYLTEICEILTHLFKCNILEKNAYFINFLPSEIHIQDLVSVFSIELLLSFLATLYPTIYTNNINPAKILK